MRGLRSGASRPKDRSRGRVVGLGSNQGPRCWACVQVKQESGRSESLVPPLALSLILPWSQAKELTRLAWSSQKHSGMVQKRNESTPNAFLEMERALISGSGQEKRSKMHTYKVSCEIPGHESRRHTRTRMHAHTDMQGATVFTASLLH